MSIYAVSDLHGQYDLFLQGLDVIGFSDGDHLWVLGDAIDRGKDGIKILQYILKHDNIDLILGNHEFMMLNSVHPGGQPVCTGDDENLWLHSNAGNRTFREYRRLIIGTRKLLLSWLKSRYVIKTVRVGDADFCLTHSFYKESCKNMTYAELEYGDVWSVVWSSIWREDEYTRALDIYPDYDYTFISGHVPVQSVRRFQNPIGDWNQLKAVTHGNLVNIDGGCAFGRSEDINNGAIFLRLDDMREFPVEMKKG